MLSAEFALGAKFYFDGVSLRFYCWRLFISEQIINIELLLTLNLCVLFKRCSCFLSQILIIMFRIFFTSLKNKLLIFWNNLLIILGKSNILDYPSSQVAIEIILNYSTIFFLKLIGDLTILDAISNKLIFLW